MTPRPPRKNPADRIKAFLRKQPRREDLQSTIGADSFNYRTTLDAANDSIMIHDLEDGSIIDVNQAMLETYGYTRDEALRLDVEALSDGKTPYSNIEAFGYIQKVARGEPQVFEWRAKKKNGDLFWVEVSLKKVILVGKEYIFAIVRNIDARKRTEMALKSQRDRFEYILEATNVGTWEWNVQTGETVFNERWADMIGYTLDELQPTTIDTWRRFLHPDDRKRSRAAVERHFGGESDYYETECRMKHKDGHWVWTYDRGRVILRTDDGEPLRVYGTHQDISDRKHKEEALRREEKKYKTILRTAVDGFWLTDLEGRLLEVNKAYCRMSGYSEDELLALHIPDLEGNMGPAEVADKIAEVQEIDFARFETRHRRKDGSLYDVDISAQPLAIGRGRLVIFIRDITTRKQAEQENRRLQRQLAQSQKMEAVGRLAGGVAHDFNNMLGVILGYGDIALENTSPGEPVRADVQEIMKAARRSADITRQLLAFARRQTIAPKVLDLNDIVTNLIKMIQRLIGEDICLTWLPGKQLWPIRIDPSQIDQALVNLCVNARDAIRGVGRITIETGVQSFDEAYCKAHMGFIPGDFTFLSVTDNGCGMDQKTLQNIFEPFYTTKDMEKGTGLGLATVYGIVKQNDGFINVYSEPDIGTTFRLYFPRQDTEQMQALERDVAAPDVRGSETILLVEDEPMILNLARTMLEDLGYRVLAAKTPQQAKARVAEYQGRIHLLLTDVVMPEMNGLELADHLQSLIPGMKRLFMSGYTANVIAHHGVLDEDVNFIAKPFTRKDLAAKVRDALNGAGKDS